MFQSMYLNGSTRNDDQLETIDYYTYRVTSAPHQAIQFQTSFGYNPQYLSSSNTNSEHLRYSNNPLHESNYPYFSSSLINNGFYNTTTTLATTHTAAQRPHFHQYLQQQQQPDIKKVSKEKKYKARKEEKRRRSRSRHSSKKSVDSAATASNTDYDEDSSSLNSTETKGGGRPRTRPHSMSFPESAVKRFEESSLHSVFQSILMPGIIKNSGKTSSTSGATTNEVRTVNSNESSKSNTIESTKVTKTTRSFSLKKLADKITSSAGVLRERFVAANKKKTSSTAAVAASTTFYSDVFGDDGDDVKKATAAAVVNPSHSSASEEYNEDLNSTISVTNLVLSEKSSINLNESIVEDSLNNDSNKDNNNKNKEEDSNNNSNEDNNETETYYSQHDCETFLFDNEDETKEKINFDNVVDLNDFWTCIELASTASAVHNPVYDVPLYQSYDDLICVDSDSESIKDDTPEIISSSLLITHLWSHLPDVKNSNLLEKMNKKEIELQERWFEIFHSELSYNKTLSLLNDIIISECKKELSEYNLNLIFTRHIDAIIQISNALIGQLQQRIKSEIVITNLFDILYDTFNDPKFEVYVAFAGEQASQKENYDRLVKENKKLYEITQGFITNPKLEGKDILSFLIAPVQRVPRYKLLVEAVIKLLPVTSESIIREGHRVLEVLEQTLQNANEKAKQYSSIAEAIKLKMLLRYDNPNLIVPNLVSTKRYLLYHSDLISLSPIIFDNSSQTTGQSKKLRKSEPAYTNSQHSTYHLILFTDILILALKTFTDEKIFYYRVIKIYNKDHVKADLAEWKMPFMDGQQNNSVDSQSPLDNEPCSSSYLLSLTIKNDNPDKLAEFRKQLDIKYCFVCNRLEGEEWIKHLTLKPRQATSLDDYEDKETGADMEYLKLNTQNIEHNPNDFIHLVTKEEQKFISVEHITLNTSAKNHAKLKKKIKSFSKK